jgi:hypothetical protein
VVEKSLLLKEALVFLISLSWVVSCTAPTPFGATQTLLPSLTAALPAAVVTSTSAPASSPSPTVTITPAPAATVDPSVFRFNDSLFGTPVTLQLFQVETVAESAKVRVNGIETRKVSGPFTINWGDGIEDEGWFAFEHEYSDRSQNYIIRVTAHYEDGSSATVEKEALFLKPPAVNISTAQLALLPDQLLVTIPNQPIQLESRLYTLPDGMTYFDETFFKHASRSTVEYLLSVAASIQYDLVNRDVSMPDGMFRQVVLRSPEFAGMYSLWYTSPPSFVVGDNGFSDTLQYSSFFHEMGHNFTLNSPALFYYGGKIDGPANAIYSESMANIFAYATAYELLNHAEEYGLNRQLALEIEQSALASMQGTRYTYDNYVRSGMKFTSWNNPATPEDETLGTFGAIAYQFCVHAEQTGLGYRLPVQRMMALLQTADEDLLALYDADHDTHEADSFRATLMVAAMSYGFNTDLREEFRALGFPIADPVYDELMHRINP